MSENRQIVDVLGRRLGTSTGWDEGGDWCVLFHDFKSNVEALKSCDRLSVDFETGVLSLYFKETDITTSYDVVDIISNAPRVDELP